MDVFVLQCVLYIAHCATMPQNAMNAHKATSYLQQESVTVSL